MPDIRAFVAGLVSLFAGVIAMAAPANAQPPRALGPAELEAIAAPYRQPEVFQKLCETVKARSIEVGDRHKRYSHTETTTSVETDGKGQQTKKEEVVERVRFGGQQEYRTVLRKFVNGVDQSPATPREVIPPRTTLIYPFTREAPEGAYRYTFDGCQLVDGQPRLVIRFEPNAPADEKFRGVLLVDPQTFEPMVFDAQWAKPAKFVNQMTMRLEWGPANNGHTQTSRSLVTGSGGFAFVQRSFRIETRVGDYREPNGQTQASVK
ncbi:MAG: hypothetical protein K2Y37_09710 [Pirellulales bacterium]|nr:hypothetical protein [Pirellulales bacterium]